MNCYQFHLLKIISIKNSTGASDVIVVLIIYTFFCHLILKMLALLIGCDNYI